MATLYVACKYGSYICAIYIYDPYARPIYTLCRYAICHNLMRSRFRDHRYALVFTLILNVMFPPSKSVNKHMFFQAKT